MFTNKLSIVLTVAAPLALLLLSVQAEAKRITSTRPLGYSIYDDGICTNDFMCRSGETCESFSLFGGICKKQTVAPSRRTSRGKVGAECYPGFECAGGLYCDYGTFPNRCRPRLPTGARCAFFGACLGYCHTDNGLPDGPGVCKPVVQPGGACTRSVQCRGFPLPDGVDAGQCSNYDSDTPGVCVRLSQQIHKLGAPCDRKTDRCAPSLNLQCRWARSVRKTVCLQRDLTKYSYCQLGNPLSRCAAGLECRTHRAGVNYNGLYEFTEVLPVMCLTKRRFLPTGAPCDRENDRCVGNARCRAVPGVVLYPDTLGASPTFSAPALYCVRTLKRFGQCSPNEKFLALCEDGFACKRGKCVRARKDEDVPLTNSFDRASCVLFPCAPGFRCGNDKTCIRI